MATIWRQSSEPIEPPAPVTTTRRRGDELAQERQIDLALRAAEQVVDRDRREFDRAVRLLDIGQELGRGAPR
jgi:hypothetical protein